MIKINKYVLIFFVCLVGVIIIAIMPKKANVVGNAIVNESNGDIAFCFSDTSNAIPMLQINLFDKNGELLFKKNLYSNGGNHADFIFDGDLLVVYVGRVEEVYCFDRTGLEVASDVPLNELEAITNVFVGWKKTLFKKTYFLNETLYSYNSPTLFNDRATLSIKNEDFEKIIYESP